MELQRRPVKEGAFPKAIPLPAVDTAPANRGSHEDFSLLGPEHHLHPAPDGQGKADLQQAPPWTQIQNMRISPRPQPDRKRLSWDHPPGRAVLHGLPLGGNVASFCRIVHVLLGGARQGGLIRRRGGTPTEPFLA